MTRRSSNSSNFILKKGSLTFLILLLALNLKGEASQELKATPSSSKPQASPQSLLHQKTKEEQRRDRQKRERQKDEQKRQLQKMYRDKEGKKQGKNQLPPHRPHSILEWLENNQWQRAAQIQSGSTIFLKRSTDRPARPDETVILRWRTPQEHARRQFLSSKSHQPNRPIGPLKKRFEAIAQQED